MKIRNLLTIFLVVATLVGCGTGANSSNDSSTGNSTSSSTNPVTENVVKIKKIDVNENQSQVQNIKARNIKKANDDSTEELNYTIITRPQSEVQFTITLDNPKAYGINALEISCDDENAEIMIEGEYKKISDYSIVLWSSENAYEKTYNIKTDSLDELTTFKVTDIRLEGETKFQSELTNSTDLGNNELQIYKMDTDAYELDVVYNTFEEIKFGIKVKEGVTNLSNFKVDGKEPDENGYWVMTESKEDCEISYDFELENGVKIERKGNFTINLLNFNVGSIYNTFTENNEPTVSGSPDDPGGIIDYNECTFTRDNKILLLIYYQEQYLPTGITLEDISFKSFGIDITSKIEYQTHVDTDWYGNRSISISIYFNETVGINSLNELVEYFNNDFILVIHGIEYSFIVEIYLANMGDNTNSIFIEYLGIIGLERK